MQPTSSSLPSSHFPLQLARLWTRHGRALVLLAALSFLAYLPPFLNVCFGGWPFHDDAPGLLGPWRELAASAVRRDVFPFWNPYSFCGLPFMSNGQTAVLYPPNLLYWALPVPLALWCDAYLHNVFLAWGAYALGRSLHLSRNASCLLAMTIGLGGSVSAHIFTGHMTWHAARSYIPWVLWASLWYLRRGDRRYAIALAVLFSLQIASGYPPLVLLGAGLCGGLFLAWIVLKKRAQRHGAVADRTLPEGASPDGALRVLPPGWGLDLLLVASLTVALSAVFVLPLKETSGFSVHGSALPFDEVVRLSGNWRGYVRLLIPGFFNNNMDQQWSMLYGAHEEAAYIGILPLLLALGAPWLARRHLKRGDREVPVLPGAVPWLWWTLPVTAILFLGNNTPVYHWLYNWVPLIRLTRVPVRWMEVWYFMAALLAAYSFDAFIHRNRAATEPARRFQFLLGGLAGALLLVTLWCIVTPADSSFWLKAPFWNVPSIDPAARLSMASLYREAAITDALLTCALAGFLCWAWKHWRANHGEVRRRMRFERVLLGIVAVDLLALFWRSAKMPSPALVRARLNWPKELTGRYRKGERWDTKIAWRVINNNLPLGIDTLGGYDAMNGKRFYRFIREMEGDISWQDMYQVRKRTALMRVAGVGHTLFSFDGKPNGEFLPAALPLKASNGLSGDLLVPSLVARSGNYTLWGYRGAWPRCYLSQRPVFAPEDEQLPLLERLARPLYAEGRYPVVLDQSLAPTGKPPAGAAAASASSSQVLSWQRDLNKFEAELQSANAQWFVVSESWCPGWRAWVNGLPVPIERANFLFRAVRVPAGRSRVVMVYEPQSFRVGAFIAFCGIAMLTMLIVARGNSGRD